MAKKVKNVKKVKSKKAGSVKGSRSKNLRSLKYGGSKKSLSVSSNSSRCCESIVFAIKERITRESPEEFCFVLNNGDKLRSIRELIFALEHMGDETFRHHVSDCKNDFSNWLKDVFGEESLAVEIQGVYDRFDAQRRLIKKLMEDVLE